DLTLADVLDRLDAVPVDVTRGQVCELGITEELGDPLQSRTTDPARTDVEIHTVSEPERAPDVCPTARAFFSLDQVPHVPGYHIDVDLRTFRQAHRKRLRRSALLDKNADLADKAGDVFLAQDPQLIRSPPRTAILDATTAELRDNPEAQQQMLHVAGQYFAD